MEVVIKAVPKEGKKEVAEDWWQYLQRARAELEASGARFRTKEEIDADLAEDRDWGEERFEAIEREMRRRGAREDQKGADICR